MRWLSLSKLPFHLQKEELGMIIYQFGLKNERFVEFV